MAVEVSVTTNPLLVYGMVGLLLGALVLALVFARPRPGLGAVKRLDVPKAGPADEPWMPTGGVLGRDGEPPVTPSNVPGPPQT